MFIPLVRCAVSASQPNLLIFDSGVGGLSVYQEIQQRLPSLNYYYFFDNAAYPYGELTESILIKRVCYWVNHLVAEHKIDLVVIACNTASTLVLPQLREQLSQPIVGVVPAIKPAADLARQAIGLIATPATIQRPYTRQLIQHFSTQCPVQRLGSTRLVDIAEEKLRGITPDIKELRTILAPLIEKVDVAVLGCTHFPLLKQEIQQVLGDKVALVDSGTAIAKRVDDLLQLSALKSQQKTVHNIYASQAPWGLDALNTSLARFSFNPVQILPQHLHQIV